MSCWHVASAGSLSEHPPVVCRRWQRSTQLGSACWTSAQTASGLLTAALQPSWTLAWHMNLCQVTPPHLHAIAHKASSVENVVCLACNFELVPLPTEPLLSWNNSGCRWCTAASQTCHWHLEHGSPLFAAFSREGWMEQRLHLRGAGEAELVCALPALALTQRHAAPELASARARHNASGRLTPFSGPKVRLEQLLYAL